MFASTDINRLPQVGDLVRRYPDYTPYRLTRRRKDGVSVVVNLEPIEGGEGMICPVEWLDYYPQVGDTVVVMAGPAIRSEGASKGLLKDLDNPSSGIYGELLYSQHYGDRCEVRSIAVPRLSWLLPINTLIVLRRNRNA